MRCGQAEFTRKEAKQATGASYTSLPPHAPHHSALGGRSCPLMSALQPVQLVVAQLLELCAQQGLSKTDLSVPELKDLCTQHGLTKTGNRTDLIGRLHAKLVAEAPPPHKQKKPKTVDELPNSLQVNYLCRVEVAVGTVLGCRLLPRAKAIVRYPIPRCCLLPQNLEAVSVLYALAIVTPIVLAACIPQTHTELWEQDLFGCVGVTDWDRIPPYFALLGGSAACRTATTNAQSLLQLQRK
jgi:hypothetical protein